MGRRGSKNQFYAYDNGSDRGIVSSWPACEAKVKGRSARYRGFPDRASAEAWLGGDFRAANQGRPKKFYAYSMDGAKLTKPRPSAIIRPQSGSGGCRPRPRKVRVVIATVV